MITVNQNHSVTRVTKNPAQWTFLPLKVNLYPMAQRSWGSHADLIWFVFRLSLHHQGIGPSSLPQRVAKKQFTSCSLCYFLLLNYGKSRASLLMFVCRHGPMTPPKENKLKIEIVQQRKKSNLKRFEEENMSRRRWSHSRRAEDTYREEMKWNQSAQMKMIQRVTCMGLRFPRIGSHLDVVRDGGR